MKTTTLKTSKLSVGDIVRAIPVAARVLDQHGVDYGIDSDLRFDQACIARSLDPVAVLSEIEAESVVDEERWMSTHLSALVHDILRSYHEPLRIELPRLIQIAKRVETVHATHANCPHGVADQLEKSWEAIERHLTNETRLLFPMILAEYGGQAAGTMQLMFAEHEALLSELARLRRRTATFRLPEGACPAWRTLYLGLRALEGLLLESIHLENNYLFPRALGARG